jgi:hypothetical protein
MAADYRCPVSGDRVAPDLLGLGFDNAVLAGRQTGVSAAPHGRVFAARGWFVDEEGDWGTLAPVDPSHRTPASMARTRGGEWWSLGNIGHGKSCHHGLCFAFREKLAQHVRSSSSAYPLSSFVKEVSCKLLGDLTDQNWFERTTASSSGGSTLVSIFAHSAELGERSPAMKRFHMSRKGQACCSATGAKVGLLHRFIVSMFGIRA